MVPRDLQKDWTGEWLFPIWIYTYSTHLQAGELAEIVRPAKQPCWEIITHCDCHKRERNEEKYKLFEGFQVRGKVRGRQLAHWYTLGGHPWAGEMGLYQHHLWQINPLMRRRRPIMFVFSWGGEWQRPFLQTFLNCVKVLVWVFFLIEILQWWLIVWPLSNNAEAPNYIPESPLRETAEVLSCKKVRKLVIVTA